MANIFLLVITQSHIQLFAVLCVKMQRAQFMSSASIMLSCIDQLSKLTIILILSIPMFALYRFFSLPEPKAQKVSLFVFMTFRCDDINVSSKK